MSDQNPASLPSGIDGSPSPASVDPATIPGPQTANLGDGANGRLSEAETRDLLLSLLTSEYGDEEWAELGSLRRIARFVNEHFERIVREHTERALADVEQRIASSVSPNFALRHDGSEDPQAAAYVEGLHDAHEIVRAARQEQS